MRLLYYKWDSFMLEGVERALLGLHIDYDTVYFNQRDWEKDEGLGDFIKRALEKKNYDKVFSINFAPIVSNICEEKGIPYVSWIYDSPLNIRDLTPLKNSCNQTYMFDRGQVERYNQKGYPVRHMALAANVDNFWGKLKASDRGATFCDISMVGQLYNTLYPECISVLGEYSRGYLEGIISAQQKILEDNIIPDIITDQFVQALNEEYKAENVKFRMGRLELEFLLSQEKTGRERIAALTLLANHFNTYLFSNDKLENNNLQQPGTLQYKDEMPRAFAGSKINLNITLNSICTGIPLRCFDIMASGGFLMSNYQTELVENFAIGEECEVYENLEDLYYKVKFYTEHEDIRKQIAINGLEKVKKEFSFTVQLSKLLGL